MEKQILRYLSEIGRKGGKKSRRTLSSETARSMVKVREAQKLYRKYYHRCFWSFDPNYKIKVSDIKWVSDQLIKNGGSQLWELGNKLCR